MGIAIAARQPIARVKASRKDGKHRQTKRRVAFSAPNLTKIITIPDIEEQEFANLWWNEESIQRIRSECRLLAESLCSNGIHMKYHAAAAYLMQSFTKDNIDRRELLRNIQILAAFSHARGLEQRLSPMVKLFRVYACKKVLNAQRNMPGGCTFDQSSALLRQVSMEASLAARQLALRKAKADRLVAKKIYEEDNAVASY